MRRFGPDAGGVLFPGIEAGADNHQHRGLGHLGLVPGHVADALAQGGVADFHQTHVLQVEGGGCEQGQLQQFVLLLAAQAVAGVVALDGTAAADGVIDMHVKLLGKARKSGVILSRQPTRHQH
ncbi:hypothetical protein D3C72_1970320 [compost metagenome]